MTLGEPGFTRSFAVGGYPDSSLFDLVRTNVALLRGYPDDAFAGRSFAQANVEYRFPLGEPAARLADPAGVPPPPARHPVLRRGRRLDRRASRLGDVKTAARGRPRRRQHPRPPPALHGRGGAGPRFRGAAATTKALLPGRAGLLGVASLHGGDPCRTHVRLGSMVVILGANVMARTAADRITYPAARRADHVDTYHGVAVGTPTAGSRSSTPRRRRPGWRRRTRSPSPTSRRSRAAPRSRSGSTALWNYERYGVPYKEGGRYFFTRNDGLQNQAVLYTVPSLDARAPGAARSQHPLQGRHRGPGRDRGQRGRQAPGLRRGRGRLRLEHLEGAERRHRPGPRRTSCAGSSSPAPPGRRTARASSTAATTSPARGRAQERQPRPEDLLPQARHAAGRGRARLRAQGPARVAA